MQTVTAQDVTEGLADAHCRACIGDRLHQSRQPNLMSCRLLWKSQQHEYMCLHTVLTSSMGERRTNVDNT